MTENEGSQVGGVIEDTWKHTETLERNIINIAIEMQSVRIPRYPFSTILFLGDLVPSSQLEYRRKHFPNLFSPLFMLQLRRSDAL